MLGKRDRKPGVTWFKTFGGLICRTVKEPTEDSRSRINAVGDEVHEEYYDALEGRITEIALNQFTYGDNVIRTLEIELADEGSGERGRLSLPLLSQQARSFLVKIEGADVTKPLRIDCGNIEGKKTQWLTITQNGKKIPPLYTKENPNGLPQWKEVMVSNQRQWDRSEELTFLENIANNTNAKCINYTNAVLAVDQTHPGVADDFQVPDDYSERVEKLKDAAVGAGFEDDDDVPF